MMNFIILFFTAVIYLPFIQTFFLNFKFGKKLNIKEREYKEQLTYRLPPHKQLIINKINGFYGLIGPDVNISTVSNLFDLFIGDGNIQGAFFENGNITLIKHFVRTDKLKYEEENGKIPNNNFVKFIFSVFNTVKLLPDMMGLANTALINIRNQIYALYERDQPYLLNINFENKEITTVEKRFIQNIQHISGHTKYINNTVETIDYDVLTNKVMYYQLNDEFKTLFRRNMNTKYMPVVHDFWSTNDKIIFVDSPLTMDMENFFKKSIPVLLNKKQRTFIHVFDKRTNVIETYSTNDSFYMFHFADLLDTPESIHIYGSLYDELDFSDLNIKGNYREIILCKTNKTVSIKRIRELEKFDLDFPIKFDDKIVFRNIHNKTINGFVVFHKMKIIKEIIFKNLCICGEPALLMVDKQPYIVAFAYSKKRNCILFVNLHNYQQIIIDVPVQLNIGFHSLFIQKN
jgi:hypothetical protein